MKKTNLDSGKWWWAYLDDTGVVRVKKYTGDKIIQNTEQLPFCRGIFDPFKADNIHHARRIIAAFLSQEQVAEAKKDSWSEQFMQH